MTTKKFNSVWDAIENTPAQAEHMKIRTVLMKALNALIKKDALSEAQAAQLFGVTQPRISDLKRGKISLFEIDALVTMAAAAGLHVAVKVQE